MFACIIFANHLFKIIPLIYGEDSVKYDENWLSISDSTNKPIINIPIVNNVQSVSIHKSKEDAEEFAATFGAIG